MAQLVIAAAGAVAGFFVGGPTGAQIGWGLGSMLGGSLTPAQKIKQEQPIMDLKVTGSEYGQPIPYIIGTMMVAGQVWWNTDRRPIKSTTRSGGGKGQHKPVVETTTITYDMDMLIGLSDNEILGVSRIWMNGKLIYNIRSDADPDTIAASLAYTGWDRITVYTGADDQLPDPTYEAAVTTALAPAYRGRGSVFIQNLHLGPSGQVPNFTFEVVTGTPPMVFTLTAGLVDSTVFGFDKSYFVFSSVGSISPSALNGQNFSHLYTEAVSGFYLELTLEGLLDQDFFSTLTLNGVTVNSAAATYSQAPASAPYPDRTTWRWTGEHPLPSVGVYAGEIAP